ncbi:MAG: hypothetical protein ACOCXJ_04185 [Planctomycetota bacterium]
MQHDHHEEPWQPEPDDAGPSSALLMTLVLVTVVLLVFTLTLAADPGPEAAPAGSATPIRTGQDSWSTPTRAVFLVAADLDPAARADLEGQLAGQGLTVIERSSIDQLLDELDLAEARRLDPATAPATGRLIGGHLLLAASSLAEGVHVRAVLVETGEILASAVIGDPASQEAIADLLDRACSAIPARDWLQREPQEVQPFRIGLGSGDLVRPGQRFAVLDDDDQLLAEARVERVQVGNAVVSLQVDQPLPPTPLRVRKILP